MTELLLTDFFIRFGLQRLVEDDWLLAFALIVVVIMRIRIAKHRTQSHADHSGKRQRSE